MRVLRVSYADFVLLVWVVYVLQDTLGFAYYWLTAVRSGYDVSQLPTSHSLPPSPAEAKHPLTHPQGRLRTHPSLPRRQLPAIRRQRHRRHDEHPLSFRRRVAARWTEYV